jgi:hypothetical protein
MSVWWTGAMLRRGRRIGIAIGISSGILAMGGIDDRAAWDVVATTVRRLRLECYRVAFANYG